jgi:hypothetical protein
LTVSTGRSCTKGQEGREEGEGRREQGERRKEKGERRKDKGERVLRCMGTTRKRRSFRAVAFE